VATRVSPSGCQAVAKRLLVASMACVTVWAIAADQSIQAAQLRAFLVKLSGRQMKHDKDFTHPPWVPANLQKCLDAITQAMPTLGQDIQHQRLAGYARQRG
jgi:hypothetical protein